MSATNNISNTNIIDISSSPTKGSLFEVKTIWFQIKLSNLVLWRLIETPLDLLRQHRKNTIYQIIKGLPTRGLAGGMLQILSSRKLGFGEYLFFPHIVVSKQVLTISKTTFPSNHETSGACTLYENTSATILAFACHWEPSSYLAR